MSGSPRTTILDDILEHKRGEVAQAKAGRDSDDLVREAEGCRLPLRGFRAALRDAKGPAVIAEIKRRSPSKGLIRKNFDPVEIAEAYDAAGATCISVLTDSHFFGGSTEIFKKVRAAVECPLIRKDFVVDIDQIAEARLMGADAVLLIVSALDQNKLVSLHDYAKRIGLDVLVEVHDENELARAIAIGADLIGVNNRNLKTFHVDLATTERIAAVLAARETADGLPEILLVAESGISSAENIERLARAGAVGFLIGESLMRQPDPGKALTELASGVTLHQANHSSPPSQESEHEN